MTKHLIHVFLDIDTLTPRKLMIDKIPALRVRLNRDINRGIRQLITYRFSFPKVCVLFHSHNVIPKALRSSFTPSPCTDYER